MTSPLRAEQTADTLATTEELNVDRQGSVVRLALNRPARRNALSRSLVATLQHAFDAIAADGAVRAVVLAGAGPAFCAGADIGEFVSAASDRLAVPDAEGLAHLLATMAACPAPILARVHGAVFGGGIGLVCAADIAIAAETARFALSEARLGLVPAVISPYLLAAIGPRAAKARMLLAAPFGADVALRLGLVQDTAPETELDARIDDAVSNLLHGAPGALTAIKRLPALQGGDPVAATTSLLAERLASDEGREGLGAFLDKRPAAWVPLRGGQ